MWCSGRERRGAWIGPAGNQRQKALVCHTVPVGSRLSALQRALNSRITLAQASSNPLIERDTERDIERDAALIYEEPMKPFDHQRDTKVSRWCHDSTTFGRFGTATGHLTGNLRI